MLVKRKTKPVDKEKEKIKKEKEIFNRASDRLGFLFAIKGKKLGLSAETVLDGKQKR